VTPLDWNQWAVEGRPVGVAERIVVAPCAAAVSGVTYVIVDLLGLVRWAEGVG
jgi:hypothetical protein